jgi:hypothetical protein
MRFEDSLVACPPKIEFKGFHQIDERSCPSPAPTPQTGLISLNVTTPIKDLEFPNFFAFFGFTGFRTFLNSFGVGFTVSRLYTFVLAQVLYTACVRQTTSQSSRAVRACAPAQGSFMVSPVVISRVASFQQIFSKYVLLFFAVM